MRPLNTPGLANLQVSSESVPHIKIRYSPTKLKGLVTHQVHVHLEWLCSIGSKGKVYKVVTSTHSSLLGQNRYLSSKSVLFFYCQKKKRKKKRKGKNSIYQRTQLPRIEKETAQSCLCAIFVSVIDLSRAVKGLTYLEPPFARD